MSEKNNNSDLNRFAASIASVLVGGGIIAVVLYFFDVDLLVSMGLWVILPILLLGLALGLVSWGTITALFSGALKERIVSYYKEAKAEPEPEVEAA